MSQRISCILSLNFNEFEDHLFIKESVESVSQGVNIFLLIYSIKDQAKLNEYKKIISFYNKEIFILESDRDNELEALRDIFSSEYSARFSEYILLTRPELLLKSKKINFEQILTDFKDNNEIKWINFAVSRPEGIDLDKFDLTNYFLFGDFRYQQCSNTKLFPAFIRRETLVTFLRNFTPKKNSNVLNFFSIKENKKKTYGCYLFVPYENLKFKNFILNNQNQIWEDSVLISHNDRPNEEMLFDKSRNVYKYFTESFSCKNIFKFYAGEKHLKFSLAKYHKYNNFGKKNQYVYEVNPLGGDIEIDNAFNLFSKNINFIFELEKNRLLVQIDELPEKLEDLALFFEVEKSKEDFVPANIKYLFDRFPEVINKKYEVFLKYSNFNSSFFGYFEDKTVYSKIYNQIKDISFSTKIPKIVHLTYGFSKNPEFNFFNYLSIESILAAIKPNRILFYYYNEPIGDWWHAIKPKLNLIKINNPNYAFENKLERYAHISDFVRLEALRYSGGIYLDLDVIANKSFDSLLTKDFVIAEQDTLIQKNDAENSTRSKYGLCNAVMLSAKDSKFCNEFIKSLRFFSPQEQQHWDKYSVVLPYNLSLLYKEDVTVLGDNYFFPFYWGETKKFILENNQEDFKKLSNALCFHLWETNCYDVLKSITLKDVLKKKEEIKWKIDKDGTYCLLSVEEPSNINKILNRLEIFEDHSNSLISLLFLTHNAFQKTKKGIDSYLRFLGRSDIKELIILDNASSEIDLLNYLHQIKKLNKVKVIFGDKNLGVAGGRQILFKQATGDIIFSLDSDSFVSDDKFFDEGKAFLSDKSIGICGPVGAIFNSIEVVGDHKDCLSFEDDKVVDTITGCSQIFRKSLLDVVEIDTNYSPYWLEDTDFCFQARKHKYILYKFKTNSFHHEWGSSGNKLFGSELFSLKHKYFRNKWEGKIELLKDSIE